MPLVFDIGYGRDGSAVESAGAVVEGVQEVGVVTGEAGDGHVVGAFGFCGPRGPPGRAMRATKVKCDDKEAGTQEGLGDEADDGIIVAAAHGRIWMGDDGGVVAPWRGFRGGRQ